MGMTLLPVFALLSLICFCNSEDRLTPAKPLSIGDRLISNGGIFVLGFFSPRNSTANSYVGIWYHNIPERTYVWVANRDSPITGSSPGKFLVTNSSDLVLLDSKGSTLWTTRNNITTEAPGAAAILLDSGNLVIRLPNGTDIWQSFHHPTDTILPNMSLQLSNNNNLSTHLVAWRAPDDPSTSDYSLGGDSSLQILVWNRTRPYWRRAALDGVLVFAMYQSKSGPIMSQTIVNRGGEFYLTYTVSDGSASMRMVLHYTGMVKFLAWNSSSLSWDVFFERPGSSCDRYASCGPFGYCDATQAVATCKCLDGFEPVSLDFSLGCQRKKELNCGQGDSFITLLNMKTPDKFLYIRNRSFDKCAAECSRNCSCTAYAYANLSNLGMTVDQSRCLVWMGELVDTEKRGDGLGETLYLRIPSSSVSKKTGALKIALPVMASLLVLVCICLVWICKSRGKHQTKAPMNFAMSEQLGNSYELYDQNSEFLWINFNDIITATDGFSDSNVLGKGGFGIVYKGTLEGGKEVAVKRLTKYSDQGMEHFRNEAVLIAKLQHRNLVRLLGYCIHGAEKLLIYEYLPNKSLDYFLFDDAKRCMLDWPTRYSIIKGVARGLVYLHHDSRMTIIHRDLKASNILLDVEMRPKISDFGMARIFGDNQQQADTRHVVGTYGYMSPEYAMEGIFSVKSDTYSYGVLLLEIVSGLKISSRPYLMRDFPNLIDYAWNLLEEGKSGDFMDTVLLKSCSLRQVSLCIHIALLCVQDSPGARPLMSLVVSMLDNEAMPLTTPKQPLYFIGRRHEAEEATEDSVNSAGLTTLVGR
ncbi:G-type lectin S-receptor-like serine/threonine-protein kinase B120 [Triticum aestivum]|uniref:G-type lectin S-receptor-like serine/threonine-protein kinase B120 n=1 Tax=Triticum aestivum TaxID=4565 RepID=UPI001D03123E|nr:G-type lectin S-receptor-like serine/threonine-protein kinase B120 [Triticum aestivum]